MNPLAQKFYEKGSEFQEVLLLSPDDGAKWEEISEKAPDFPRGWFELSRVSTEDRIEFTRDFWLDVLPFSPSAHPAIARFFEGLDDVALIVVKQDGSYQPEMVYSLADGSTFFRGLPPAGDEDLRELRAEVGVPLPRDYLSYLRIHNGFGKLSEIGVLRIEDVGEARRRVKNLLMNGEKPVKAGGKMVDPGSLIPFFEAIGQGSFQCFYADWYPSSEMGNVYLSGIDYTISDTTDRKAMAENLAFTSFLDWLASYVEGMSVAP